MPKNCVQAETHYWRGLRMGLFLSEVMSKVSERPRVYPASQYGFTHRVASENKIE